MLRYLYGKAWNHPPQLNTIDLQVTPTLHFQCIFPRNPKTPITALITLSKLPTHPYTPPTHPTSTTDTPYIPCPNTLLTLSFKSVLAPALSRASTQSV